MSGTGILFGALLEIMRQVARQLPHPRVHSEAESECFSDGFTGRLDFPACEGHGDFCSAHGQWVHARLGDTADPIACAGAGEDERDDRSQVSLLTSMRRWCELRDRVMHRPKAHVESSAPDGGCDLDS